MNRADVQAQALTGVLKAMARVGEPIEVGRYEAIQDPETGDRGDPQFVFLAQFMGVLMQLTDQQRVQLMPAVAGIPDRLPAFVAYLPPVGFALTASHKLRLRGRVYDPVSEPADLGGMGVAWELYLRASNG